MFYKLKPQAPGAKVKPPDVRGGRCFVQGTPQDSDLCLKAGSLVLYKVCMGIQKLIIMQ